MTEPTEMLVPRDVLARLAAEFLDVRDETNAQESRRRELRGQLMPILEDIGGSYVDEQRGLRLYVEESPRFEWDAKRLYRLVEDGLLKQSEFDDALETIVKKDVVQGWLDKGLITDRQLQRQNAKQVIKIVRQLQVEPVGKKR